MRRTAIALAVLGVALALVPACAPPADVGTTTKAAARQAGESGTTPVRAAAESWDREALAAAQPCLVTLSDAEPASLRAVDLTGRVVANDLWRSRRGVATLLLDADAEGPRISLSESRTATDAPAAIFDTILVLDPQGTVTTASEPTTAFPLASAAVFLEGGDLLWLRRRETLTSIDTTMGLTDARTGATKGVVLHGAWPRHRFVASLIPLRARSAVAVVLKTDGSPGPHDDYAVVLADYQDGRLEARSAAYRDDTLFTLGPGPRPGTLVYARSASEQSARADEIIELMPSDSAWIPKVLSPDAACDPGFDFQHVCAGGPDGGVLYRAATAVSAQQVPGALMLLPAGKRKSKPTGVRLDLVGNQWAWLRKPIL